MYRFALLLLTMILCCEISSAQNDPNYIVYLKNKSAIVCFVEEYTFGSSLKGVTPNGSQFFINEADILKMEKIDGSPSWSQEFDIQKSIEKAEAEARERAYKAMMVYGKSGSGSGSGQGNLTGSGNGNGNGSGSGSNCGNSWGLAGRSLVGYLPKPTYNSQETGTVVVEITVDKTGAVVATKVISKGTSVQSSYLWAQAESAAKKAKFNSDPNAPALQKGTITYHFTLK